MAWTRFWLAGTAFSRLFVSELEMDIHEMNAGNPPLHVVHIISGLGQGGAETVLHRLVTAPSGTMRHTVISLGDAGVFGDRLEQAGVPVHTLRMKASAAAGVVAPWRLYKLLRSLSPDVVQTWMYHADLLGGLVSRAARIPALAWGIRNSGADLDKGSRSAGAVAWLCARLSHWIPGVIVACADEAARRHRDWGYDADRMLVIPNGYDLAAWGPDPEARAAMRAEWGLFDDTPVIGSVARWNPLKDHANLIHAFSLVLRHRPDVRCVLVGEGMDPSNTELRGLLQRHGVEKQVLLLGRRNDVPQILSGLDLYVLSSRAEGFPNVVAEAMATGVPCVVTDVGDAARIVGDAGWVVPPLNAPALAGAVESAVSLLDTDAGRAELAARAHMGRSSVEERFGLEVMVKRYEMVWSRLASDFPSHAHHAGAMHSNLPRSAARNGRAGGPRERREGYISPTPYEAGDGLYSSSSNTTAASAAVPSSTYEPVGVVDGSFAETSVASDAMPEEQWPRRLLFLVNNPAFFLSHRLPIALAAQAQGYDVHVATMDGPTVPIILGHGLKHHVIPMTRSGRNPLQEVASLYAFWKLFRHVRPDIVHAVTIKPVLYGGIAARLARVPAYVAAVSGLGFIFMRREGGFDALRLAATQLYRWALGHRNSRVVFQNANDRWELRRAGVVQPGQTVMIRGSGVDLNAYSPAPEPQGAPVAIMVARLLTDKGVREFVQAARLTAGHPSGLRWVLVGAPDPGNPASISDEEFQRWQDENIVICMGEREDVVELYQNAHIAVLPSYREGLPRSLVEAAACGRAVVTTDVPGCRDAIEPGVTGLLVPVRNPAALADAVVALASDATRRQAMGAAGRKLAEEAFDINKVVQAHLDIYDQLLD